MDVNFLSGVRRLPSLRRQPDLQMALSELLIQASGEAPMTIKGVRDKFSKVNRLARAGQIQVVQGEPGEETVIVSVKALADMIRAASASLSFADGLAAAGFVPTGKPLVQREGFQRDSSLALETGNLETGELAAEGDDQGEIAAS